MSREIVAPLPSVRFAPLLNAPFESVSAPATLVAPPKVTVLDERLIVRLFKVMLGRVVPPTPPKTRFEVAPPTRVPVLVAEIVLLFKVRVCAPIAKFWEVNMLSVPLAVQSAPSVTVPDPIKIMPPRIDVEIGSSLSVVTEPPEYLTNTLDPNVGTVDRMPEPLVI